MVAGLYSGGMTVLVRPPVENDLQELLTIDAAYAAEHGVEAVMSAGALRFFGRSEHSFTAEGGAGEPRALGFALAQALWTGDRPQVVVRRVAAEGPEVASALVKAVVKSAYDSGVYDLSAHFPPSDALLRGVLEEELFGPDPQLTYVRVLGSRGPQAARRGEAPEHG